VLLGVLRHDCVAHPDVALVDIRLLATNTDEGLVVAQTIRAEHSQG
jgi:hypothetical protein